MSGIRLEDVTKRYPNGVRAVDDVSARHRRRRVHGAGRAVRLRQDDAPALDRRARGRHRGHDLDRRHRRDREDAAAAGHRDGVPELRALPAHVGGRQPRLRAEAAARWTRASATAKVRDIAGKLGLDELLDRKPSALSGGQRQRVAMGRAIVREPKAFLMDEPLSNLDAKLRVSMRAELARLHERLGVTTVYVTHDQVEAMTLGERVAVMRDGVLQQVDTPQNLFNQPAQPVRGRVHRLAGDEPRGGQDRRRAGALRRHRPAAAGRLAAGRRAAPRDPRACGRATSSTPPAPIPTGRASASSPTWSSSSAPRRS